MLRLSWVLILVALSTSYWTAKRALMPVDHLTAEVIRLDEAVQALNATISDLHQALQD